MLYGLDLVLNKGEVLCLFGRNGAGKTTTLKAIMGLVPASAGSIRLDGQELTGLPAHEVPKAGVAYVPQGRRLFAEMTVAENIEIGLMARGKGKATRENVLDLFPLLRQRLRQRSGTLSRRRAADAGHGPRALPRAAGAAARRADRRPDAVDDRQDPRDGVEAARDGRLDHPGRAARRCRAVGRRPGLPSSKTVATARPSMSRNCAPTRRRSGDMWVSADQPKNRKPATKNVGISTRPDHAM